jgi:hypothetical protein
LELISIFAIENDGVTRSILASERVMKRESGANPEQTRCCKLRLRAEQILLPLSPYFGMGRRSDNGSKSEDLPIIL